MTKRVEELLDRMTLEEQVSLLAGRNIWETVPIERLDIPRMRVSDGPAGVRGTKFDGPASMNVPCGTAIAASWNRTLVRRIGELLGRELHAGEPADHRRSSIGAQRIEAAMRDIEDFEHAKDQCESQRDDEQPGRIGQAIDQDGKDEIHGRFLLVIHVFRLARSYPHAFLR